MLGVPAVELLIFALLGLHGTVPTIVLLLEACPCAAITTMFAIQFHHVKNLPPVQWYFPPSPVF